MTRALAEAWKTFDMFMVPPDADEAERFQIRRGFYGGMYCLLSVLDALAELPKDQREAACAEVRGELTTFVATLDTRLEGVI